MMGVVVEVTDQYGGYIRAQKQSLTKVHVEIYDARNDDGPGSMVLDLKEPKHYEWLKSIFQPMHFEILTKEA